MKSLVPIRLLFWVAALYDGLLGILFIVNPTFAFERFDVTPPNHPGYVQFPAALLVVFAWMFVRVATDPVTNRGLILYGALLKLSYCAVIFHHWATSDVPRIWKPFAIADLVFLLLFVAAMFALRDCKRTDALNPPVGASRS